MKYGLDDDQLDVLRRQMNEYRYGARSLPDTYIKLHRDAAEAHTQRLLNSIDQGTRPPRVIADEMISDGWCDGMRVLRLVIDDSYGNLRDFRWSDANGGSWFEKLKSGGQVLAMRVGDPGYF